MAEPLASRYTYQTLRASGYVKDVNERLVCFFFLFLFQSSVYKRPYNRGDSWAQLLFCTVK